MKKMNYMKKLLVANCPPPPFGFGGLRLVDKISSLSLEISYQSGRK